jgi:hypothetical protein
MPTEIPSQVLIAYSRALATLLERHDQRRVFRWAFGAEGGMDHLRFFTRTYSPELGRRQLQARTDLRELHRLRRHHGLSCQALRRAALTRYPYDSKAPLPPDGGRPGRGRPRPCPHRPHLGRWFEMGSRQRLLTFSLQIQQATTL